MKKQISIAILIINWQHYQLTIDCLSSLEAILPGHLCIKLYLLDNGSTNESFAKLKQYIKSKNTKNIQIYRSNINLGYVGGNNFLVKQAIKSKPKYLCFLNNDTRVNPDFLRHLVNTAEKDNMIGAVGGKIYYEKGSEPNNSQLKCPMIWYAGGIFNNNQIYPAHRGHNKPDKQQYNTYIDTDYITGCLFFVNLEVFLNAGQLNKDLFNYGEDVDLSMRIKNHGYRLVYCPDAIIWHKVSASFGRDSYLNKYYNSRNTWYLVFKYLSFQSKIKLVFDCLKDSIFHHDQLSFKTLPDLLRKKTLF